MPASPPNILFIHVDELRRALHPRHCELPERAGARDRPGLRRCEARGLRALVSRDRTRLFKITEYYDYTTEGGRLELDSTPDSEAAKAVVARLNDEVIPDELRAPLPASYVEAQEKALRKYWGYVAASRHRLGVGIEGGGAVGGLSSRLRVRSMVTRKREATKSRGLPVRGDAEVFQALSELLVECGYGVVSVGRGDGDDRGIGEGREGIGPRVHHASPG